MSMPIPKEFLESNAAELVALAVETLRLYTEPGARQAVTTFIRASCAQVCAVRVCTVRVWGRLEGDHRAGCHCLHPRLMRTGKPWCVIGWRWSLGREGGRCFGGGQSTGHSACRWVMRHISRCPERRCINEESSYFPLPLEGHL